MTTEVSTKILSWKPSTWIGMAMLVLAIGAGVVGWVAAISARPTRAEAKSIVRDYAAPRVDLARLQECVQGLKKGQDRIEAKLERILSAKRKTSP